MKYLNMLEKLIKIFNITKSSWAHIICVIFTIIILILTFKKKINKNKCFTLSILSLIFLFSYVIITHDKALFKIFDDIMDNFFVNLYFPSIYVYSFILIVIYVATFISLINIRKKSIYKTINATCFIVINFILTLILENIANNSINLFEKSSLFSNKDLIILLESSVSIFIIWLMGLAITYLTEKVTEIILLTKKEEESFVSSTIDNTLSITNEVLEEKEIVPTDVTMPKEEVLLKEEKVEPKFINQQLAFEQYYQSQINNNNNDNTYLESTNSEYSKNIFIPTPDNKVNLTANEEVTNQNNYAFDLNSFIPKRQDNIIINNDNSTILDKIINNTLPLQEEKKSYQEKYEKVLNQEKDNYTLNDYKVFNKMLKDIKEHNQSNTIRIDKILEYRLITKYSEETYNLFKRMLKNYSN